MSDVRQQIELGPEPQDLEALFRNARASEPQLAGDNFTKMVLNRLPARPIRVKRRNWWPDLIGGVFAMLMIYNLVDPAHLLGDTLSQIPASLIISLPNLLLVASALVASAMAGWWIVEQDN